MNFKNISNTFIICVLSVIMLAACEKRTDPDYVNANTTPIKEEQGWVYEGEVNAKCAKFTKSNMGNRPKFIELRCKEV